LASDALVQDRRAVLLAIVGNEPEFETALLNGAWGKFDSNAAQVAFTAHLARDRQHDALSHQLWTQALATCAADRDSLRLLTRLAMTWRWTDETAEGFQTLLRQDPRDLSAARRFAAWGRHQADSALWQQALLAWRHAEPENSAASEMWARLALVRDDAGSLAEAVRVAEALSLADPGALPLLALARHKQGRNDEAIAILEKLPPGRLTEPRAALVYGALLASAEPTRASRYLDYAARSDDLLPEERLWLKQARSASGTPDDSPPTP
jgi:hypothetical protein